MSGFYMNKFLAAAVIGGSVLASAVVPASSATISVSPRAIAAATSGSTVATPVEYRRTYRSRDAWYDRNHRKDRYERSRHGPRYSHQRRGYDHYRNGYWYRTPFWALTIPLVGSAALHNSRHATWCDNRYRSYTASRDAFKGYDGRWHRCNSPFN